MNINSAAGDFSDANKDPDHNGFTRLDEYLEFMGGAHYFARRAQVLVIDLKTLARGYTNAPVFTVKNQVNGIALQLPWQNGIVYFVSIFKGISSFTFTVKDAEGSSMTRAINIAVSDHPALPVDGFDRRHFTQSAVTEQPFLSMKLYSLHQTLPADFSGAYQR
jgi:hypothetical protein